MTSVKIEKGTVIRTVLLLIALANQVLTALGRAPLPFADETVTALIGTLFTAAAAAAAWWKNNSFTEAAIRADRVKEQLKAEKRTERPV